MSILVIGSTGKVGSEVIRALLARGAKVHALTRDPKRTTFPSGVTPVKGDTLDKHSLRAAYSDIDTLFMINPVARDELPQALTALSVAAEAGIKRVVYSSMLNADTFSDTAHAASKYAAERMIERFGLSATILRPTYFMQNDLLQMESIFLRGVYAMPIGSVGVSMVDLRDVAEVAAVELLKRQNSPERLPTTIVEVVGPNVFTGEGGAALWSEVLGRKISYGGDDLDALEQQIARRTESWLGYDQSLMFRGFHREGMIPKRESVDILQAKLGKPLRTYRAFAEEMAIQWQRRSK